MFDQDRSAARGLMSAQKLIVFRHDSELGNAPANKLFDLVKIKKLRMRYQGLSATIKYL